MKIKRCLCRKKCDSLKIYNGYQNKRYDNLFLIVRTYEKNITLFHYKISDKATAAAPSKEIGLNKPEAIYCPFCKKLYLTKKECNQLLLLVNYSAFMNSNIVEFLVEKLKFCIKDD